MSIPVEFESATYVPEMEFDKLAGAEKVSLLDALKSGFINKTVNSAADKAGEKIVADATKRFFGPGTFLGNHPNVAYGAGGAAMAAHEFLGTEAGQEMAAKGLSKAKKFLGMGGPSTAEKVMMGAGAVGAGALGLHAYKKYKEAPQADPNFDKNNGYGQYYTGM